jgi:hypothetical protein
MSEKPVIDAHPGYALTEELHSFTPEENFGIYISHMR